MTEMLFNTSWWGPLVVGAIGVVVFVTGNRHQETRVRSLGLAIVLLAVLFGAVSYFVDTPLETAEKGTSGFVEAVVKKDGAKLTSILDPMASLTVLNSATPYSNAEIIVAGALRAVDQFGIKSANILSMSSARAGTTITVTIDVLSDQEATYGRPMTTSWQFEWSQTSEGLLITRITCLRIGDATGDNALSRFPSGVPMPSTP